MKIIAILGVLLLVLATSGLALADGPSRVTGGGTYDPPPPGPPVEDVSFAFTARLVGPGTAAEGEFEGKTHDTGTRTHVGITDMSVAPGPAGAIDAWMGGIIEQSTTPANVGRGFVIRVRDSGEGAGALQPDMRSGVTFSPPGLPPPAVAAWVAATVTAQAAYPMAPLTGGNIQIK